MRPGHSDAAIIITARSRDFHPLFPRIYMSICSNFNFSEQLWQPLLFRPWFLSRILRRGRCRGAVWSICDVLGPCLASRCMLWAFQVAANCLVPRDRFPPSLTKQGNENLTTGKIFLCCHCVTFASHRPVSCPLCGNHGATAVVAHQAFPLVTATDGAFVYACVHLVSYRPTSRT